MYTGIIIGLAIIALYLLVLVIKLEEKIYVLKLKLQAYRCAASVETNQIAADIIKIAREENVI